jgi:proteasome lid subunit RPN8/RPN11
MSDVTFGTWNAAASPVTIEYSLVVIEEIRQVVAEGFQKLSRGGIEVGGLLYGVHEGQTVRIMAIRPAACEHAGGPSFRLSERDRAALHEQIRQDQEDQRLDGLVCVGWYVSHTRTEISLSESDREIFSTFFAKPWQVTLVVRPSRGGNMRAGFFVWEPGGTVNSQSYLEFSFPDRMAAGFDHRGEHPRPSVTERERHAAERRSALRAATPPAGPAAPAVPPATAAPAVEARPRPQSSGPTSSHISSNVTTLFGESAPAPAPVLGGHSDPASSKLESAKSTWPKKWFWLVAALIVIAAAAVVGARFLKVDSASETVALRVLELDGQLAIEWNRQAAAVSKAVHGTLEIIDGPQTRNIPLQPGDLALGKFFYKRETGDVQVRMIVEAPDGKKVQEASRFLGSPPAQGNTEELKALQQRRDELEAEVARLKESNDQQAQRVQQLERTLKILQTRPGVP